MVTAENSGVLFSRARLTLGLNIACAEQRYLREHRTGKLVYENCEESYICDYYADMGELACERFLRLYRHAERYTRLRKKGDAEVINYIFITFHKPRT